VQVVERDAAIRPFALVGFVADGEVEFLAAALDGYADEVAEMRGAGPEARQVAIAIGGDEIRHVVERHHVCPDCEHHFYAGARDRIAHLLDEGSFEEWDAGLRSLDPLEFVDRIPYSQRIKDEEKKTGLPDAAITGKGFIRGRPMVLGITDFAFMAGSMGSVVGEKLTRAAERALELRLPLVFVSGSGGGARMQEGILSLMQMAKVSCAIRKYRDGGGLYVGVLTHPTMGGVAASWALQGDLTLAEPKAMVGFAGARTIKNTIRLELPPGFRGTARTGEIPVPDQRVPVETRFCRSNCQSTRFTNGTGADYRLL
jgi:acetyl-CoA carboxylase carboxyl transferase subunit beta